MMEFRLVSISSAEWQSARVLRYQLFFAEHGLPPTIMDDGQEQSAWHLVAIENDKLLGYGRLNVLDGSRYQVSQMVVAPDYQGRGVGRKVLRKLIELARQHDAQSLQLSAKMTAIGFYRKDGFDVKGEAYLSPKTAVEHVLMEKHL